MTDSTTRVAVPIAIKASVALLMAGAALSWVTYLASPVTYRPIAALVVGGIIASAIVAFLIYKVYRGRHWARILLTVLAILGTVLLTVDLITGVLGYIWLDLISQGMSDVSVILLWTPSARRYFADISAARLSARNELAAPASRE